ncbi:outer membrane beta-barrel protein [Galbibacter mesophilus]|uniref:outer membrane beta-barrel protein n=1 Tax=Galbibacter mesophilus TaxID=379069 RepID=UPI00191FF986|nr:outer membrane beta-barrel protein [Galbibacter mesophilus]MCM5662796.1 outer membrane beta-barrel protein [Galbibacter mesophilus]
MNKKLLIVAMLFGVVLVSNAQEQGKFRVGLDIGYTIPKGGGGVMFDIEPKYNIADNMNVGIRVTSAAMAKEIEASGGSAEAKLSSTVSYLGTYDYYFHSGSGSFAPYLGAGLGYYGLGNFEFDSDTAFDGAELDVDGKFGGMIRGGFELGKFRLGVEYNIIPKTDLGSSYDDGMGNSVTTSGEIKNSYFGISLGFYLGGGKWGK